MTSQRTQSILVAVEDPVLHPEAVHVAAATGRSVVDTINPADIARHFNRVSAVLVDATMAAHIPPGRRRDRVFLLSPDPGPSDWKLAMQIHADQALLLPAETAELLSALGRDDSRIGSRSQGAGVVIGVMGVVGGAGASTLAAALALRKERNHLSVLIDAVASSGGIDLLVGAEDIAGARWPDVGFSRGTVQAADVLAAIPTTADGIHVLSSARSTILDPFTLTPTLIKSAIQCLLNGDERVDVVVDLPSGHLDQEVAELLSHLVLVVPSEVRAIAAALTHKLAAQHCQVPTSVVLRHRGWSGMDIHEVEELLSTEIIAELGTISKLPKTVEMHGLTGTLPKTLAGVADAILAEVSQ